MEVNSLVANGAVVVSVAGEVDLYSSPTLRHEIVHWTRKKIRSLIVDLGAVTYMDSSGIATLVEGHQLTKRYGGRFRIARPGPPIREVLGFAHLDKIFRIFGTVEEALEGK
jgi:anti-sigma B factor antagonist